MTSPSRLSSRAWLLVPLAAVIFVLWCDFERGKRVAFVSRVAADDAAIDPKSPTGYADGKRWLIVPEHDNHSFQWIEETQQMLAQGELRVRHVDYENAPYGRPVFAASPYRWWLGFIAWCDHATSGRSTALAVERVAYLSEPLIHVLLILGLAFLVCRWFGSFAAALGSLALALMFPLAAAFLPGVPDSFSLVQACIILSVLPLVSVFANPTPTAGAEAGKNATPTSPARRRRSRHFFLAGVAGAFGLWLDAGEQLPILEGIILGALIAVPLMARKPKENPDDLNPPWRAWALGGAVASLLSYLVEFFPSHMEFQLRVNHPLYGVAWLGAGEILAWLVRGRQSGAWWTDKVALVRAGLGVVALAALPVAMARSGGLNFLSGDLLASRLTNLPDGTVAKSTGAWLMRDGLTASAFATLLPALILIPAGWVLFRRTTPGNRRVALAIAFGPALVACAVAMMQLRWWNILDGLAAILAVVLIAGQDRRARWWWAGVAAPALLLGALQLLPGPTGNTTDFKFTRSEVEELYERALAHWLRDQTGPAGATVLVPPFRTSSFCFYGSLRGLGTQNWENRDGLQATFRIVNATRPDESQALVNERGITHIVLPSWDTDLDEFARLGLKRPEDSFIFALDQWVLFNWLRPLPYKLPPVAGFEGQTVKVLAITDEADPATHRSRLVEYFVEMQQLDIAEYASRVLRKYPADLGALVALAQVEKARGDADGFATDFRALVDNLGSGTVRGIQWDRRVSLAVVLALGQRNDLAREQLRLCLEKIDEAKIRSLTTGSLYHLLVLCRVFGAQIADPGLRAVAVGLLPAELRSRL